MSVANRASPLARRPGPHSIREDSARFRSIPTSTTLSPDPPRSRPAIRRAVCVSGCRAGRPELRGRSREASGRRGARRGGRDRVRRVAQGVEARVVQVPTGSDASTRMGDEPPLCALDATGAHRRVTAVGAGCTSHSRSLGQGRSLSVTPCRPTPAGLFARLDRVQQEMGRLVLQVEGLADDEISNGRRSGSGWHPAIGRCRGAERAADPHT